MRGFLRPACARVPADADGYGKDTAFNGPTGIAMDGAGTFALVVRQGVQQLAIPAPPSHDSCTGAILLQVDSSNFVVRFVDVSSARVSTLAGDATGGHATGSRESTDGRGTTATFKQPLGVAVNEEGTLALVVSLAVFA